MVEQETEILVISGKHTHTVGRFGKLDPEGIMPNPISQYVSWLGFTDIDLLANETSEFYNLNAHYHKALFERMLNWQVYSIPNQGQYFFKTLL